ncbi:nuclease-related domain-containing protein [Variovorax paradoxus]|uniref:nuclease-related domain-containing protein n=1 Tax=Variovorax paradoxus TaxID=34073 RepID=UPI002859F8B0|nr:nuclease-related domain-containing protein [Variovorax paradoxus]MDR6456502.1 hypothetical protein [Variovorax paradoxus]
MTTPLPSEPSRAVLSLSNRRHRSSDEEARQPHGLDSSQSNTKVNALAIQQIVSAFKPEFGRVQILENLIIPMYGSSAVPTARFDVALVCEAGVYLFEVKSWRNAVVYRKIPDRAPPRWFLRLHGSSLAREVKDPTWQCGRKTTHLRSLLPPDLRVQYFVILPFEGVELEGVMPSTVVTPQDLPYIARVARSNGRSEQCFTLLDQPAIDRTLQLLTDLQGELTLDEHIRNTREKSAGAAATRTRHPGILKLQ